MGWKLFSVAGAGLIERANAKGALCDDRYGAVCRTAKLNIQYLLHPIVPSLLLSRWLRLKPFRYIRPASYRFDYTDK